MKKKFLTFGVLATLGAGLVLSSCSKDEGISADDVKTIVKENSLSADDVKTIVDASSLSAEQIQTLVEKKSLV